MSSSLRRRAGAVVTGLAVGATGLALSAIGATPASADNESIVLSNPSFEQPITGSYTEFSAAGSDVIGLNDEGWSVVAGTVDVVGPQYWVGENGTNQSLDLNGSGPGKVCQTIGTVVGATYAVDFAMSRNGGVAEASLLASAEDADGLVGSVAFTHSDTSDYFDDPWSPTAPNWMAEGFFFDAESTETDVCFAGTSPTGNAGAAIDEVTVTRLNQGPSITITNPSDGERFFVGQQDTFAFSCTDPDDEDISCDGVLDDGTANEAAVDPGDPIPTATPGVHTLTVYSSDGYSEGAESETVTFSVVPTTATCRGTGAKLLGLTLGDANPPAGTCANRTAYTAIVDLNLGPATIPALANKVTLKAPKGDTISAPGFARGQATLAELKVKLPTLGLDITALGVESSVTSSIGENCVATTTPASSVAKLVINGKTTLVGDQPLTLPLLGGIVTIKANERVQVAGVWTARALVVDLPGTALDVVVAESTANTSCPPVIVVPPICTDCPYPGPTLSAAPKR